MSFTFLGAFELKFEGWTQNKRQFSSFFTFILCPHSISIEWEGKIDSMNDFSYPHSIKSSGYLNSNSNNAC
jgi:hypothetical protein